MVAAHWMSPDWMARCREACGILRIVTSRPFFLKMPASLASVSGAKPVQPEMADGDLGRPARRQGWRQPQSRERRGEQSCVHDVVSRRRTLRPPMMHRTMAKGRVNRAAAVRMCGTRPYFPLFPRSKRRSIDRRAEVRRHEHPQSRFPPIARDRGDPDPRRRAEPQDRRGREAPGPSRGQAAPRLLDLPVRRSGSVLLQRRSIAKSFGRLWANTCCGHPRAGEQTLPAAHRRLGEELGASAALAYGFRAR